MPFVHWVCYLSGLYNATTKHRRFYAVVPSYDHRLSYRTKKLVAYYAGVYESDKIYFVDPRFPEHTIRELLLDQFRPYTGAALGAPRSHLWNHGQVVRQLKGLADVGAWYI